MNDRQGPALDPRSSPARDPRSNRGTLQFIARQAMIDHGLRPEFSPAALDQARTAEPARGDGAGIRDLRGLLWSSIDNDDSMDLDQIEVAERLPDGAAKVLIGIADVDALVPRGSAIDQHAATNTTSVYVAGRVYPMLPERLSTDLTSLGPDVDRLAVISELTVTPRGEVKSAAFYRALVRNRCKLAYRAVAAWLDGKSEMPPAMATVPGVAEQVKLQDQVADALRAVRRDQGALTLRTIQSHAVFDGDALRDLVADDTDQAKALIEDFMIAANGAVARFLEAKGFATMRRVVKVPKHWERLVALAAEHGFTLPSQPDPRPLNAFLSEQQRTDPLRFPDLSLAVVKLIGSGEYDVDVPGQPPPGHFGLAVRDYAHSTAPNRRYPDIVTQRLLKAAIDGRPSPYALDELRALAEHCTAQEDEASKVERQVGKSAAAMLLQGRTGQTFDAIVTGSSEKGTWVRIAAPPVEGRVVRNDRGLEVGQRVRVRLARADVARGFIDFARV
jgi:VacB/RNase II family 3'-5' exoribonuclease